MDSSPDLRPATASAPSARAQERQSEPVAVEVPVVVAGARASDSAAQREIFSESTQTVLIFENGAVIRLSAGVTTGQLLFITNKKNGREVVAQVKEKRGTGTPNGYVELQFTESSPGYWGAELPASTRAAGGLAGEAARSEKPVGEGAPLAHQDQEVTILKQEVAALRQQLQSVLKAGTSAQQPLTGQPAVREAASELERQETAAVQPGESKGKSRAAEGVSGPSQESVVFPRTTDEEASTGLKGATPSAKTLPTATASRGQRLRLAFLTAVLVMAAATGAWYYQWLPAFVLAKLPAPGTAVRLEHQVSQRLGAVATLRAGAAAANHPRSGLASDAVKPTETALGGGTAGKAAARGSANASLRPGGEKVSPTRKGTRAQEDAPDDSGEAVFVPPKLLKSVRPISPPEAIRSYVTGNVVVDAIVETNGRVKSAKAVSGAEVLQRAAIETVKQYEYAPATRGGKPVAAHVSVTVQFWYEP